MNADYPPAFWQKAWKPVLGLAILLCPVLLAGALWSIWSDLGEGSQALVYYTLAKSDLPIVVTERGSLESQVETVIRCDVENVSIDRSGNYGTQIIFIVPNGSAAETGDLLVELDSAAIRDRLDQQVLDYERAKSQRIQAVAKWQNQKTQNETLEAQARLRVQLAELDLKMYMDEDKGTHQLEKETILRAIDEARASILDAQGALELAKTDKVGMEALFKLGYRGKTDREKTFLDYQNAQHKLAVAMNRLRNQESALNKLDTYVFEMQRLTLEGDVATSKRALDQTMVDNESLLAQAEASKTEAEKSEEKEKERLEKLETQLGLCKIYAPHDGMVVYARERSRSSSSTEIAEGVTVRQRQEIITLPDLSVMQVKTQIHEAVLDQVRTGLPVTVRVDAFPNRVYNGYVHDVGVVPTSSYYTNVKTYECVVRIAEKVEQLKPGMTAVVDIHVDRIRDVLAVPVQAIVQIQNDTWCYVEAGAGVERRDIELGRSNDKFVHVLKGLAAGERLVLNPMAILDETRTKEQEISPDSGAPEAPDVAAAVIAQEEANKKKASPGSGKSKGDVAGRTDEERREAFRAMREKRGKAGSKSPARDQSPAAE